MSSKYADVVLDLELANVLHQIADQFSACHADFRGGDVQWREVEQLPTRTHCCVCPSGKLLPGPLQMSVVHC